MAHCLAHCGCNFATGALVLQTCMCCAQRMCCVSFTDEALNGLCLLCSRHSEKFERVCSAASLPSASRGCRADSKHVFGIPPATQNQQLSWICYQVLV